ncbi:diaminopimelate epimerase [Acidipila sp. EB88]|uniref:diaminopimelate epimerase n=1 Tax=Acidipila sp. EB88 TaxID=2305226 RepID=UPI000F5FA1B0|nr:diaminopimelate epimerase [Acidipila sp. EB88]RRA47475.1 diaminopimelate epimerase [Acidipila sp. EB88]
MLEYSKAHACGNDFLIVERAAGAAVAHDDPQEHALAVALCARTTGVGADGVEFLEWTGERSGTIRLRNADGGIAEISGNGTRCVAAWMAHRRQAEPGDAFKLQTDAGERVCFVEARDGAEMRLRSAMGIPLVERASVSLDEDAILVEGAVVSTGNPHFVIRVEDASFRAYGMDWETLGRAICFHPQFPAQTNVEFVHVRAPGEIAIRIFERGVGPTSSSGTGTCATAAASMLLHGCKRRLAVHAPGGMQTVSWPGDNVEMELTGPAVLIATGLAFMPGDNRKVSA